MQTTKTHTLAPTHALVYYTKYLKHLGSSLKKEKHVRTTSQDFDSDDFIG